MAINSHDSQSWRRRRFIREGKTRWDDLTIRKALYHCLEMKVGVAIALYFFAGLSSITAGTGGSNDFSGIFNKPMILCDEKKPDRVFSDYDGSAKRYSLIRSPV